jgi:hypothetical protein
VCPVRRAVLLLGLCSAVLAGLWWAGPGRGEPSGRGASGYGALLRSCIPATPPSDKEEALATRLCLADVFRTAHAEGGMTEMVEVLADVTAADPWLRVSCHPAAHMLTEEGGFGREELFALLVDVEGSMACDWALGHAAVSGLGMLGEKNASPGEVLGRCLGLAGDESLLRSCVDGLGHFVWLASGSLERSVEVCETAPQTARLSCGGGVLMQMFEPATQTDAAYERAEAASVIPGFCARWREIAREQRTVESCAHGAGYVYGLDLRDVVFDETRRGTGEPLPVDASPVDLSAASRGRLVAAATTGRDRCDALGADVADFCGNMLVRSIPAHLGRVDRDAMLAMCAVFRSGSVRSVCVSRVSAT